MVSYVFIIILFLISAFLITRFGIYLFSQKHTQCKVCKSFDTERVERGFFIKDFMLMSKIQKYWCRKCWNYFYFRN